MRREHRGSGIGVALLEAAVDWAAQHGASVLEGHPVDLTGSPATRHHPPSSLEPSPCFSGPGSPRSDAPTEPDP
ncbi:MAG: GNAT family N-acetyltransferase [Nocardioidaceae bacterium]